MATRRVHFKFTKGPNIPAVGGHFLIRPLTRNIDGATVNLAVWDRVTLDRNGEAFCDLIVSVEGTTTGYEVKEAPGELGGPAQFAVPPGDTTLEYSEALPPVPGAYVYDLTGGLDFPADAPAGAQGVDTDTWIYYSNGA